jgi:eukaryotic-like serine/threonine-protein kinase
MESAPADVLVGRMLDRRYHVRSRIAHGGMATVYLATDTRLDREVALKVMHADLARDADFVARFIGEAKSVAKLSHPNIVGVYDQGADGQYLYLVMEYVPGRTLRELLRERGWLPWQEALSVMDPVLAGLAAAHQAGIVHRDVKPENVLITADGRVKVVDFGLARASAAVGNTQAGMIIGSVNYIAPEQVTGAPSDARTDVYAAGILLFEMLTGRQPFSGETPLAVAYAHVNSDVPVVSTLVGGIPASVDQLVQAATARNPRLRPTDAGVFLRATRTLRGIGDPADSVTGAWAVPAAAGTSPQAGANPYSGANGAAAGPQTLLAGDNSGGYGGGGGPALHEPTSIFERGDGPERGGSPFASLLRGDAGRYDGGRHGAGRYGARGAFDGDGGEPFLQRWLFSRRLVYVVIVLVVLVGIGGGGWWLSSGRYTSVPNVAKMTAASAKQALLQDGFQVQTGSSVIDDNVPKDEVISTSPSGRALPGATIVLTISQGPRMIVVPQIPAGDNADQARALLRKAGLTVAPGTKAVGGQAISQVGTVAGTTPAAGQSWPENQPVYIDEVTGIALPNMVGQNFNDEQQWASQNQITLNPTTVQSNQQQGTIIAQSPAAQTPVKPGDAVAVQVSAGPPEVAIPDETGQQCSDAQNALQGLGFQVTINQNIFGGGKVLSMNPTGQAPSGSTITLTCGYGHFGF